MITLTSPLNATLVHGITGKRMDSHYLFPPMEIVRFAGAFPDTLSGTVYSFLARIDGREFWYETHESELRLAGIEPPTTFDTFD
jgi:hypothetical protein